MTTSPALAPLVALLAIILSGSPGFGQESRHALVIGNNAYEHVRPLLNPGNDARAFAGSLESVGFEVSLLIDGTLTQTREALRTFIDRLPTEKDDSSVALVYFAGHGVQIGGTNYLIPVDAAMARDYEVPDETLGMDSVMRALESAGAGLNLLVLDCCRNNPFSRSWRGSRSAASGGLAIPTDAPQGMFIAFSTSPGDVAEDGDGANSPYTAALVRHLPTPGAEFEQVFKRVGRDVAAATGGEQEPWFNSKFYGTFRFATNGSPEPEFASRPEDATRERPWKNSLGLEFVPLPGKPGRFMARTETRVRDFRAFARSTGHDATRGAHVFSVREKPGGGYTTEWIHDSGASWENPGFPQTGDHPVVCVSWHDANAFCSWLSRRESRIYRLPSDEEWSAATAPDVTYPWGSAFPPPTGAGNYWDRSAIRNLPGNWENSVFGGHEFDDGAERTAPVGSYPANRYGFLDLGGNVWEWCASPYRSTLNDPALVASLPVLREETTEEGTPHRVLRGASWDNFVESDLRSAFRDFDAPDRRDDDYGFRILLDLR